MSRFYGCLQGCRGEATRCGSTDSGIRASVQNWDFSLISRLDFDREENLRLTLDVAEDSRGSWGDTVFRGKPEDFTTLMKLVQQVGTKEVIELLKKKAGK